MTGYGDKGAMKDAPGFDNTAFWCRAGLLHDMMDSGCTPPTPPCSPSGVGDILCGTLLATGVLAALRERDKTGLGSRVRTSLLGLGLYSNFSQMLLNQYGTTYPKTRTRPNRALSNSYPAKDGWIYLVTLNFAKDFPKLVTALGRPDLVGDPRWATMKDTEGENNPKAKELCDILEAAFQQFTIAELREKFKAIDMALGEYRGCADELEDPQAWDNGFLDRMTNYDGKEVVVPTFPLQCNDEAPVKLSAAPAAGADTLSILKEVGYSDAEIEDMLSGQAVFTSK
ncbi:Cinnamoyl-CoA:phenyllactate CoA-transferase [bioreactor metagenome]|uniref:Cinnamoyl-CoA:phenyllactate CoA-transferase n=1 Tax=bioreactor metagenome TaxID=1076179 RepID=A0A645CW79_9ZZZZ